MSLVSRFVDFLGYRLVAEALVPAVQLDRGKGTLAPDRSLF